MDAFDVIILGTGLTESITAAALSKAGFKVAHIDSNPYYGADEASLSLDELIQWADDRSGFNFDHKSPYIPSQHLNVTSISRSSSTLPQARQYCLSLWPSIIPSLGPFVSSLISSGVSRYGGFKLLERVAIYDRSGTVKHVPGSKEDVFKNKSISLVDKRRLMRFLMFAAGEFEGKEELMGNEEMPFHKFLRSTFSLNEDMANMIAYSLTYCTFPSDPTLSTLHRVRRYLRSAGRYGASSFLVGHYGGLGEIAQGFCRSSAVSGGVYILGKHILSIDQEPNSRSPDEVLPEKCPTRRYRFKLDDFAHDLTCDLIISPRNYLPAHLRHAMKYMPPSDLSNHTTPVSGIARCIAIIDQPISLFPDLDIPQTSISEGQDDTSVLVFPPSSLATGSSTAPVNVLVTGEGSKSAPQGKLIVYISTLLLEPAASSPELLLRPYLDATLSLTRQSDGSPTQPLFTIFYAQKLPSYNPPSMLSNTLSTVLVTPPTSWLLPESSDSAVSNAEAVFWETVKVFKPLHQKPRNVYTEFFNPGRDSKETKDEIDSFWPPQDLDVEEEW